LKPAIASRTPDQIPAGTKHRDFKPIIVLLALLAGFICLLSLLPLSTAILMGADEGFALSKAVLYLKGYHFYTEVWNDQPLLHTVLIAEVLKHICVAMTNGMPDVYAMSNPFRTIQAKEYAIVESESVRVKVIKE
jgi:uncharacterized membrane protein